MPCAALPDRPKDSVPLPSTYFIPLTGGVCALWTDSRPDVHFFFPKRVATGFGPCYNS